MMEEDQEQRFLCKFCNKSFFSARALGGHTRGHLALISAEKFVENCNGGSDSVGKELSSVIKASISSETDIETSHSLRENPKKSWRISDKEHGGLKKSVHVCKKCCKRYPSLRALSVHIRTHLMEEPVTCKECGKNFGSMKALFGHMRWHPKKARVTTELDHKFLSPIRKKRSRTRYDMMIPNLSSCSDMSASSSTTVTEIDEVKEAAACLMMLSRGYEVALVAEVGMVNDNLEVEKLVDQDSELDGNMCDDHLQYASDGFEILKDSDRKGKFECKTTEVFNSRQVLVGYRTIHKTVDSCTELQVESCVKLTQTSFTSASVVDSELQKPECYKDSIEKQNGAELTSYDLKKSSCYECSTCLKVFKSGQALGGHKRAHYAGPYENRGNKTISMGLDLSDQIDTTRDLKFRDTLEEEPATDVDLEPWLAGNNRECEPLPIFHRYKFSNL